MPFSDLQTKQIQPWTLFSGNPSAIDITPGTTLATFKMTHTCELKRLQASAVSLTAASQFVIDLVRNSAGTPVVIASISSAVPYVAGVVIDSGEISVPLFKDEPLLLLIRGSDADADVATGLFVLASLQMRQEQDGQ